MERIMEIEIAGTKYPLNFSVKAAKEVSKKYGDVSKIADALSEKNVADTMGELIWLLALLIDQGVAYKKIVDKEEVKGASEEELEVIMNGSDFLGLNEILVNAMTIGMTQEVEITPDPNDETTQNK
jgi:hypothetical protein